jgi:predicted type IV restriction endonuclease
MLASVFGFDKYSEITSEQAVRGTYCDLAVTVEGTVQFLIEVKAIGLELKENHLRQAVNYGANHGIPWVVLTNGVVREVYRLRFEQPIDYAAVVKLDFLDVSSRKKDDQGLLYLLCKEGLSKAVIDEYHKRGQSINRFVIAAIMQSDPVIAVVRRELKRLAPDLKVDANDIVDLLPDVLKRDVCEGEAASTAKRKVSRASQRTLRKTKGNAGSDDKHESAGSA